MKIIIEGGDHVGKTTAAKMLSVMFDVPIIHAGLKDEFYDHTWGRMQDLKSEPIIYDRFHLSAFVYGRLLGRHRQNLTDENFIGLVQWLIAEEVKTVIMYASDELELERRMIQQGKAEAFDLETRMAANRHYKKLAEEGWMGHHVCELGWDISTMGFPRMDQVVRWV